MNKILKGYIIVGFCNLLYAIINLIIYNWFGVTIDLIAQNILSIKAFTVPLLLMILGLIIKGIAIFLNSYHNGRLYGYLVEQLHNKILDNDLLKIQGTPKETIPVIFTDDIQGICSFFNRIMTKLLPDMFMLLGALFCIYKINLGIMLFALITNLIVACLIVKLSEGIEKVTKNVQNAKQDAMKIFQNDITHIELIKANNMEQQESKRYGDKLKSIIKKQKNLSKKEGVINIQAMSFTLVSSVFLAAYSGYYLLIDKITLGEAMTVMMLSEFILNAIMNSINSMVIAKKVKIHWARYQEVIKGSDIIHDNIVEYKENSEVMQFEANNISFAYPDKQPLFSHFCLKVYQGDVILLYGSIGCGKSTLLKVLTGVFQASAGQIYYEGKRVNGKEWEIFRKRISYVGQEPAFFTGTIYENFRAVNPSISDIEIKKLCKLFGVDDVIEKKDNGYQTMIDSKASIFSGGEKQRISIIRSLLKQAEIVFMDEPTSALDDKNTKIFIKQIEKMREKKTFIIVTHDKRLLELNVRKIEVR